MKVQAIIGVGKPTVVVLINGGVIAIDWISENAPAILEAWYVNNGYESL